MLKKLALVGVVSMSLVGCGGGDSSNHTEATKEFLNNKFSGKNQGFKYSGSKDKRAAFNLIKHGPLNVDNKLSGELKIRDRSEIQLETLPDQLKNAAFLYKIEAEGDAFSQFDVVELNVKVELYNEPPGPLTISQLDIQDGVAICKLINGAQVLECKKEVKNDVEYFTVELSAPVSEQGYYLVHYLQLVDTDRTKEQSMENSEAQNSSE
ncbi:Uncharacterized protein MCB1EB_0483 [Mycoavidus cysteinexigens]|uniref:Uncharacterized protein n=2 Tax=Mycoavidus cysteinexigens TaxID=1553431 RepID=A0A2Z6ETA0_9BURK|nr:hypothetical protein [Mycoavidus cysteinexigens]BBE08644.1 Uncharacterized protein MCB1EB_0483 [Mycoavidus cysteinexigens]GLR01492.1 hypothetical protein GCM10007934_13040 [Mycoavidus cysteinexigens]